MTRRVRPAPPSAPRSAMAGRRRSTTAARRRTRRSPAGRSSRAASRTRSPAGVANWAADSVGPVTSSVAARPPPTNSPPTVTASVSDATTGGSDVAGAEYFIDSVGSDGSGTAMSASDGSFSSATEGVTATLTGAQFSALSEGTHTVYVHGRDKAGNWGATASATFIKDTVSPAVTLTNVNGSARTFPYFTNQNVTSIGGACGTAAGDSGTVSWSVSGASSQSGSTSCSSGSWSATLPTALSAEGVYTVSASQSDSAGNTGSSGSKSITIDKSSPSSSASSPQYSTSTSFSVSYTATEFGSPPSGLDKVEIYVKRPGDSSFSLAHTFNSASASDSFTYSASAGDGSYRFYSIAYDKAGNSESKSVADTTTVLDTVAPTISDNNDHAWHKADYTVHLTATDATSGVKNIKYSVDGGPIQTVN